MDALSDEQRQLEHVLMMQHNQEEEEELLLLMRREEDHRHVSTQEEEQHVFDEVADISDEVANGGEMKGVDVAQL